MPPRLARLAEILRRHLTGEQADAAVDLAALAPRTTDYSDLEDMCSPRCSRLSRTHFPSCGDLSPRTRGDRLSARHEARHFEKALSEIVATASTHSDSIAEIRS